MKLWEKGVQIDKLIEDFTVGNDRELDLFIAPYDVIATKAHAKMLQAVGILNKKELNNLITGLDTIQQQIEDGSFIIEDQFEDVHSKIEHELVKAYGSTGKKIHTARSRNDQVLTALHLYFKNNLDVLYDQIEQLFKTLLSLAESHQSKFLPGYTHFQRAMPSSFGLWFSAYAEILIDDVFLLKATRQIIDQNPLGSAAGYGSSFPIDREFTTREMNFADLKYNVVAAQMSRGKSEMAISGFLASLGFSLGKMATDICVYINQEFNFIDFPESLTTGSSIMPHKKNPDVFELIRGKCNRIQALPNEIRAIVANLPSGYHRDFQLLKQGVIYGIEDMKQVLEIFDYSIKQIIIKDLDPNDTEFNFLFTVDNINELVLDGMSFREAYQKVASEIKKGEFKPKTDLEHTHIGSIHNLALDRIRDKFPKI
ncbi:MAG: argininosuccinate lyase [Bacteroidia bacterium]|nr:argininosuccinate lyase [Bacteroidia bacterium]MBT8287808.1 argininosuccinate lyase [Bacteroidia bacterium]